MDRIRFIINPKSGSRRYSNLRDLITGGIDKSKFQVEISYTEAAGHATQLCLEALDDGVDFIAAVGGDGTINEVCRAMISTSATLAIVPIGSGNGLARHLGIPLNIDEAIRLINKKKVTKIDTAKVNDTPFVSIAGIGFDALVAKEFEKSRKRGFLNYFLISAGRFPGYKPKKYKLLFNDGTEITEQALLVCFANSNQFGYNTTIAPHARLDDGKLDICIVKKPRVFEMPLIARLLLIKRIDQSPLVQIIPSEGLTINRKKNSVVNIDGEAIKLKKKLVIKVNPLSLNVLIP